MLAEELATLAGTSATTLVAAMTTDAWQGARSGIARLFGHAGEGRQKAAEIQLDSNADLVARADDPDRARQSLAGLWTLELEGLLGQHPSTAGDLRTLMTQVRSALPPAQQLWVQTNTAQDNGTVFAAQGPGAKVIVHPTNPSSPPALAPDQGTRGT